LYISINKYLHGSGWYKFTELLYKLFKVITHIITVQSY
jgi:hypothetical protein